MKLGVALGMGVCVGEAVIVGVAVSVGSGEGSGVAEGVRVLIDSNRGTSRVDVMDGSTLESPLLKGRLQAAKLRSKIKITDIRFIALFSR